MILLFILFSIFYTNISYGQVVTASINPSIISINPAAGAFSRRSFVNTKLKKINIEKSLLQPSSEAGGSGDINWSINTEILTSYTSFIIKNDFFSLEGFYAYQDAEKNKVSSAGQFGEVQETTIYQTLHNNQANLAFKPFSFMAFGLKFMKPDSSSNFTDVYSGTSFSYSYEENERSEFKGIGYGVTFEKGSYSLGMEYLPLTYEAEFNVKRSETNAGVTTLSNVDPSFLEAEITRKGIGISALYGNPKTKALRLEVSYQKMNSLLNHKYTFFSSFIDGERKTVSAEFTYNSLFGTFSMIDTKGDYIDFKNLINYILSPEAITGDTVRDFKITGGLVSSNGFSISGSFSTSKSETLEGIYPGSTPLTANTKKTSFGISFSFRF